jgi:hypothetical protein
MQAIAPASLSSRVAVAAPLRAARPVALAPRRAAPVQAKAECAPRPAAPPRRAAASFRDAARAARRERTSATPRRRGAAMRPAPAAAHGTEMMDLCLTLFAACSALSSQCAPLWRRRRRRCDSADRHAQLRRHRGRFHR